MRSVYSERHRLRDAATELHGGRLVAPFEHPARAEIIRAALIRRGIGPIEPERAHGLGPTLRIHDAGYVDFLSRCWRDWKAAGFEGEAIPTVWPSRRMPRLGKPTHIEGEIGYYALAAETAISEGTWEAAQAAADVALTGAAILGEGARAAFALCRPPGHHAAQDMFGGYCFLNNAAIAAQALLDAGAARVALLDVDFHHGNGTQAIFYERPDVLFLSIHGAPEEAFPHFLGGAEETGAGEGLGFNANFPLPRGTGWAAWEQALLAALERIRGFAPEALVVSLGVDAYREDPISFFTLDSADFGRIGAHLAGLGLPTLFVMEGGYAVSALGENVANALEGFDAEAGS